MIEALALLFLVFIAISTGLILTTVVMTSVSSEFRKEFFNDWMRK